VEGLYISTGLIQSYPKNILPDDARNLILTPIMQVVLNQKKSVTDLLKMLSSVEQTDPVSGMVADLQELEKAYATLNIEDQIQQNRADLVLTDKNLEQITTIVTKMRKAIVE
jgi:arginine/lysine/ornithine decarboxylase